MPSFSTQLLINFTVQTFLIIFFPLHYDVSITNWHDYRAPQTNAVVPEPLTINLIGLGLLGFGLGLRRRN